MGLNGRKRSSYGRYSRPYLTPNFSTSLLNLKGLHLTVWPFIFGDSLLANSYKKPSEPSGFVWVQCLVNDVFHSSGRMFKGEKTRVNAADAKLLIDNKQVKKLDA